MFNQYPYLNLNDLNLDYLLNEIKSMYNDVTNFVSINAIKYADPIQWNITSQYEKNTVVIDPLTGTAYISVAAVPSGVALTRTEYWTVVFDLGSFVTRAAQNFTSHWESDTTTTATFSTTTGGWLVWGDVLYKALTNITAGDTYVIGGNIEHFTIEDLYNAYLNTIAQILAMVGDLTDLTTTDKSSLVGAINEVANQVLGKIGNLDDLTTTDKTNLVAAINEVAGQVLGKIGDLDDLTTEDKTNLVAAINEIDGHLDGLHIVSVKDFGAVGDGVTDDEAAFNRWIDYVGNNGAIGYIPNGTYFISHQTISYREETGVNYPTIIGESKEGVILKADPNVGMSLLDFRNCGARIEHLTLDCSDSGSIAHIHFGLYFVDCDNVLINDVDIINTSYCGCMAYCSDPSSKLNTHFTVNKLKIVGTGKESVGDSLHPMGCIFENMRHSTFSDVFVSNVKKYAFEFKDYCRDVSVVGLNLFNCGEGLYFGGNADNETPPTGFYCTHVNIVNYVARAVDYPIYCGRVNNINISNFDCYDNVIRIADLGNSRIINISGNISPGSTTTHYLKLNNATQINAKFNGRTTTFAGYWIECAGNCYDVLLELYGVLTTTNTTKVLHSTSGIKTIDYNSKTKYNLTFADGSYT